MIFRLGDVIFTETYLYIFLSIRVPRGWKH